MFIDQREVTFALRQEGYVFACAKLACPVPEAGIAARRRPDQWLNQLIAVPTRRNEPRRHLPS